MAYYITRGSLKGWCATTSFLGRDKVIRQQSWGHPLKKTVPMGERMIWTGGRSGQSRFCGGKLSGVLAHHSSNHIQDDGFVD
jgi:hypothetical protein